MLENLDRDYKGPTWRIIAASLFFSVNLAILIMTGVWIAGKNMRDGPPKNKVEHAAIWLDKHVFSFWEVRNAN